jgi:hypothetical protein
MRKIVGDALRLESKRPTQEEGRPQAACCLGVRLFKEGLPCRNPLPLSANTVVRYRLTGNFHFDLEF